MEMVPLHILVPARSSRYGLMHFALATRMQSLFMQIIKSFSNSVHSAERDESSRRHLFQVSNKMIEHPPSPEPPDRVAVPTPSLNLFLSVSTTKSAATQYPSIISHMLLTTTLPTTIQVFGNLPKSPVRTKSWNSELWNTNVCTNNAFNNMLNLCSWEILNYGTLVHSGVNSLVIMHFNCGCILDAYEGFEGAEPALYNQVTYNAMNEVENYFLCMVEQEMGKSPDLIFIGSCALLLFLHGMDLYTLSELGAVAIDPDDPILSADDLADQIAKVLNFLGLGAVMCLGVTADAYILTFFAMKYRQCVLGLILVSPLCKAPSWTEWLYNNVMSNLLYFYGMCGVIKEILLKRYFSKEVRGAHLPESDIVQACQRSLDERQSLNVWRFLEAINGRSDISERLRKLQCRSLFFVRDMSLFHSEARTIFNKMKARGFVSWNIMTSRFVQKSIHGLLSNAYSKQGLEQFSAFNFDLIELLAYLIRWRLCCQLCCSTLNASMLFGISYSSSRLQCSNPLHVLTCQKCTNFSWYPN